MRIRPPRNNIYLAYGSNLNVGQMALRCPSARPVGTGVLVDRRLAFRGRRRRGVLTVEPWDGKHVPVVAWEVTFQDELSLDRYEGFPSFYGKEKVSIPITSMDGGEERLTYPWARPRGFFGGSRVSLTRRFEPRLSRHGSFGALWRLIPCCVSSRS